MTPPIASSPRRRLRAIATASRTNASAARPRLHPVGHHTTKVANTSNHTASPGVTSRLALPNARTIASTCAPRHCTLPGSTFAKLSSGVWYCVPSPR
jgi:hypothetical protein